MQHHKKKEYALEVEHLTVNYERMSVLWDVNLTIPQGKMGAIVGPNGAGKSTFLKACMGLLKPSSGKILFFGQNISQVRSRIAYVPQRASVDWDFPITAFDLVLMGIYGKLGLFKWVTKKDREKAKEALHLVGMSNFRQRQIGQLSGGQQQKLFIARAMMQEADLYLMDEPFAGIDKATEESLVDIFHLLKAQGKTLIMVHHDLSTVKKYFDWIVLLNTCLISYGSIEEAYTEHFLYKAYGQSTTLLHQAAKLAKEKTEGTK